MGGDFAGIDRQVPKLLMQGQETAGVISMGMTTNHHIGWIVWTKAGRNILQPTIQQNPIVTHIYAQAQSFLPMAHAVGETR
jgi:desulfoferrodoxin (superoxide reductase-like protein)